MSNVTSLSVTVGTQRVVIEHGLLAQQARGAVTVRLGDTIVLSAVTAADQPREGIDYFPLQVEYRERYSACGKFPGGYFKREGRPSEKEIVTARLADRPIRPLFTEGFRNDVQINTMLLSADGQNDADVLSVVAASAALTLSDLPFMGPIAAVRVGRVEGRLLINPTHSEREQSDLNLVYAGNRDVPVMIEGGGAEISEPDLLAAMRAAHAECVKLVDAQIELRRRLGLPDKTVTDVPTDAALLAAARDLAGRDLAEAMRIVNKLDRRDTRARIGERLKVGLLERVPGLTDEQFRAVFDALEIETVRRNVLAHGRRVDGRGMDDLRPLEAHVGLLPRVHGSAFFGRGETQALASVTLGSASDSQAMDAVTGGPREKTFVLHYNFPPYSVGEVGRVGSPGRREIGHGALAERALAEVMPADYPYTVRVVSDIMSSNGSTSMASVCAGSLALMDAGVPVRAAVAGISMGLFTEGRRSQLVVDIIGEEDHCGDMDFKVAGTRRGVTAFQVDIKIRGLDWAVVEQAFAKARDARLRILDFMATVLAEPRKDLSPHAPRIHTVKIPPDRIGDLIGPGGKHIRRITDISGTQIDVEDDGTVKIFSASEEGMKIALHEIRMMTAEAEEGAIYSGVVTGIKPFGVFVEIFPGRDGLVHVSELADFHVRSAEEICKIGDQMWVKCLGVDEKGRIRLSRRAALAERDGAAQRGTPA